MERRLAEDLRVSRSPVRGALRLLAQDGVVGPADRGGFVVLKTGDDLAGREFERPDKPREEIYLRVAEDRLNEELPDRITENELMRRYELTRSELADLLRRMTKEGWIDRLPGYGWEFAPMLTTMKMYEDSYRFRLVIEPAGSWKRHSNSTAPPWRHRATTSNVWSTVKSLRCRTPSCSI